MTHWTWIDWTAVSCLALGFVVVMYLGYMWLDALAEVNASPREEMFHCEKHGPFRKVHAIQFMGQHYCVHCWGERLKTAKRYVKEMSDKKEK